MEFKIINKYNSEITKDFNKYAQSAILEDDFKIADLKYLLVISDNKYINQNELSTILNIDKSMVTRSIKRLVDIGYVSKEQDENDTRSYRLSLSNKSENILIEVRAIFNEWFDKLTIDFTEEEKKIFINLIKKAHENRISK